MQILLIIALTVVLTAALLATGPGRGGRWLRVLLALPLALLALLLIYRSRGALLALLPLALPLWQRWRRGRPPPVGAAGGPDRSTITTRFLHMTLDHDSGALDGEVREGRFAGRPLADLDTDQLGSLWSECQRDPQSAAALENYLDRVLPDWAERFRRDDDAARGGSMPSDRAEALAVLGLDESADRDQIKAAHRRLMQRVHPDHGGSDYLAARINAAKKLLLDDVSV